MEGSAARPRTLFEAIDVAPIGRRYKELAIAVMLGATLEYFDFYLIAFVVPEVSDEWGLSRGQEAAILLSAGLGIIIGSVIWGKVGDRLGRRRPLVAGIVVFSVFTALMALAPDDGWIYLTAMRFVVGIGVGGVAAVAVPLLLEYTPTRVRSKLVGLITTATIPLAILIAAVVTAAFIPLVGWRPLFAIGLAPIVLALYVARRVPESARWLVEQDREDEARAAVADILSLDQRELPDAATPPPAPGVGAGFRDLVRYRRSFWGSTIGWLGAACVAGTIVLWGPTFVKEVLDVSTGTAALLFVVVTLGSFGGRLYFSFAPARVGRRRAGMLMGFAAVPVLVLTGIAGDTGAAGGVLFLAGLVAAAFLVDGGYANLVPYTSEVFPTRVRAQAMGSAQAMNGLGRIIGPALFAGIVGTSGQAGEEDATFEALTSGFVILALCALAIGLVFRYVAYEPHGKDLETLAEELEAQVKRRPAAVEMPAPVAAAVPAERPAPVVAAAPAAEPEPALEAWVPAGDLGGAGPEPAASVVGRPDVRGIGAHGNLVWAGLHLLALVLAGFVLVITALALANAIS
jgi:putative MFS transporter